jgi:hypothetical protein
LVTTGFADLCPTNLRYSFIGDDPERTLDRFLQAYRRSYWIRQRSKIVEPPLPSPCRSSVNLREAALHIIITLIIFVVLAAIIVWVADWVSVGDRRATAVDILNRRLARGEIDRAEYDEKRRVLGR